MTVLERENVQHTMYKNRYKAYRGYDPAIRDDEGKNI
jgi:hypothetical protein